jgi:hypothetical protein
MPDPRFQFTREPTVGKAMHNPFRPDLSTAGRRVFPRGVKKEEILNKEAPSADYLIRILSQGFKKANGNAKK